MAKKKKLPTKDNSKLEKSDEILEAKQPKKLSKEEKVKLKEAKKKAKENTNKKKKAKEPKKRIVKGTVSELKKVSWPSFKQACKQTGAVLVVVGVFLLVVFGFDLLLSWITKLFI